MKENNYTNYGDNSSENYGDYMKRILEMDLIKHHTISKSVSEKNTLSENKYEILERPKVLKKEDKETIDDLIITSSDIALKIKKSDHKYSNLVDGLIANYGLLHTALDRLDADLQKNSRTPNIQKHNSIFLDIRDYFIQLEILGQTTTEIVAITLAKESDIYDKDNKGRKKLNGRKFKDLLEKHPEMKSLLSFRTDYNTVKEIRNEIAHKGKLENTINIKKAEINVREQFNLIELISMGRRYLENDYKILEKILEYQTK